MANCYANVNGAGLFQSGATECPVFSLTLYQNKALNIFYTLELYNQKMTNKNDHFYRTPFLRVPCTFLGSVILTKFEEKFRVNAIFSTIYGSCE